MKRWFVLGLSLLCVAACGGVSAPAPTADSVATQVVVMKAASATPTAEAPTATETATLIPTATQTATLIPTATPTVTATPTPVPTTPPMPELIPGPEDWTLYESEELNVAIYHPPDWTAFDETAEAEGGGTVQTLSVRNDEGATLWISEKLDLASSSAEQWADGVLPSMNADDPGAYELKLQEPITTLDGGDGAVVAVLGTHVAVGWFQGVVIYEETAFFGLSFMPGGMFWDEEISLTYMDILKTIQRR
jgi:hypothetical protein